MLKDYLGYENARNKRNAHVYTALMQAALRGEGKVEVLIGHHLTFEVDGRLETENEVPSADCLMFDHPIMKAVFGAEAIPLMRDLAALPCDERDELLKRKLWAQITEQDGLVERGAT